MAVLNKEFAKFDNEIKLSDNKRKSLMTSIKAIKNTIRKWFLDNKGGELQPRFHGQGSIKMGTAINPIAVETEEGDRLYKYDLDYGVYFIEKDGEDNRQINTTWHSWVYQSVDGHTKESSKSKNTCVRVVFADGHHIDLPIYYKDGDDLNLVHKSEGLIESDPKEFYEWFNNKKKGTKLERIVRLLKAWKNFREHKNTDLKLPSGFIITILATDNYVEGDTLDVSFRETIRAILAKIDTGDKKDFKCLRPTTPEGENVFDDYSDTKRDNFLTALNSLLKDLDRAKDESNFKKSSEILINNQFGDRFPKGEDIDEEAKSKNLSSSLSSAMIPPKPYAE